MAAEQTRGKVLTGARVKLRVADKTIGYATVASYAESISYEPIMVLDQLEVAEHVPVAYDVSFSASHVRIIGTTLKGQDQFPGVGTGGEELLLNTLALSSGAGMTASIEEQGGDTIVELFDVKVTSHAMTVGARGVVGEDVTFVAIRANDESGV